MTTDSTTIDIDIDRDDADAIAEKLRDVAGRFATSRIIGEATVTATTLIPALKAVLPHVLGDEEVPERNRIHLDVNAGITVWSTDGYTAGIARIPVDALDDYDGSLWSVLLAPDDAKLVVAMFTPGKDEQIILRITAGREQVTFTDVSGMFTGRELTVPIGPIGERPAPDILRLASGWIRTIDDGEPARQWLLNPTLTTRFVKSAAAYKEPMWVQGGGVKSPLLVWIGASFLGVLMPIRVDDDADATSSKVKSWRDHLVFSDSEH